MGETQSLVEYCKHALNPAGTPMVGSFWGPGTGAVGGSGPGEGVGE